MTKLSVFQRLCSLADAIQAECVRVDFSPHKLALEAIVERLDVLIDDVLEEREPLRLYRWEDAPPALRALSTLGGAEVLLCVAPPSWLNEEALLLRLPHVLWLLLLAPTVLDWPEIERTWGAVQRVAQADGSTERPLPATTEPTLPLFALEESP